MTLDVKSMTDEELELKLEELRTKAPERLTKPKKVSAGGTKKKTASLDAVAEAMAKLLGSGELP